MCNHKDDRISMLHLQCGLWCLAKLKATPTLISSLLQLLTQIFLEGKRQRAQWGNQRSHFIAKKHKCGPTNYIYIYIYNATLYADIV